MASYYRKVSKNRRRHPTRWVSLHPGVVHSRWVSCDAEDGRPGWSCSKVHRPLFSVVHADSKSLPNDQNPFPALSRGLSLLCAQLSPGPQTGAAPYPVPGTSPWASGHPGRRKGAQSSCTGVPPVTTHTHTTQRRTHTHTHRDTYILHTQHTARHTHPTHTYMCTRVYTHTHIYTQHRHTQTHTGYTHTQKHTIHIHVTHTHTRQQRLLRKGKPTAQVRPGSRLLEGSESTAPSRPPCALCHV